jgi:CHAD domain-containing protein
MSYRFKSNDRSIKAGLRRIALERIDQSLAVLHGAEAPDPDALHLLRKNVKKLRGLLRLVRPVFADFDAENAALREAGKLISGLRESDVLLALLDRHATEASLPDEQRARLARAVTAAIAHAATDPQAALDEHRLILTALRARAETWKPRAKGFAALEPGLRRTLEQARKAHATWCRTEAMDDLHRLRKRLKEHWYHAQLLQDIWPHMMTPHVQVADDLGEVLGDARDHALLAEALDGLQGAAPIIERAGSEAAKLRARAAALGAYLLAEEPQALAQRWGEWYALWRR